MYKNFLKKSLFVFLYIFLSFCNRNQTSSNNKLKHENILPEIRKFEAVRFKNSKISWQIEAEVCYLSEDNKNVIIKNGIVKIYDSEGKFYAACKFESANLDLVKNNIDFIGENIIDTVENEKIITYDMKYNSKENKIFSLKPITILKDNITTKGVGFETIDGFKTIKIYKNVIEP